jgi:hypothetical protein
MAYPRSRRRRCAICHHGFTADAHVGDRQLVCSRPECQKARRKGTQAAWRKRHPGYFIEWRAKKRAAQSEAEVIDPPRLPPPLDGLPWELAQVELGSIGADFIASLGRKVLGHAKDQSLGKALGSKGESGKEDKGVAKDQSLAQQAEVTGESPKVAGWSRKTRARPRQDGADAGP